MVLVDIVENFCLFVILEGRAHQLTVVLVVLCVLTLLSHPRAAAMLVNTSVSKPLSVSHICTIFRQQMSEFLTSKICNKILWFLNTKSLNIRKQSFVTKNWLSTVCKTDVKTMLCRSINLNSYADQSHLCASCRVVKLLTKVKFQYFLCFNNTVCHNSCMNCAKGVVSLKKLEDKNISFNQEETLSQMLNSLNIFLCTLANGLESKYYNNKKRYKSFI